MAAVAEVASGVECAHAIRCMRITLTVDNGILIAVKERARRENRTAGEVLEDLARPHSPSRRRRAKG